METEKQFIMKIANDDIEAAKLFTEIYAAPVFRLCRLYFNDHYRAAEFVEEFLAGFIARIRTSDVPDKLAEGMFNSAWHVLNQRFSALKKGKGLSSKQKRILELMETIPLRDRLALDLVILENHSVQEVNKWLDLPDEKLKQIENNFKKMLSSDETIKEFLEYAAIQQSKQREARERARRKAEIQSTPQRGKQGYEGSYQRQSFSRYSEERESVRRSSSAEYGSVRRSSTTSTGDAGGETKKRSDGIDEKRSKPRPRRRRVDPRKLNIDL